MRKRIATSTPATAHAQEDWLDLERAATVEVTSEDIDFPIESSLSIEPRQGWRAAQPIIRTVDTELAVRRIQWFTIIWMAVEVAVAFIAAIRAHSVALAAFSGDSAIELLSAAGVLVRFRSPRWITEQFAGTITGWLLVALAAYIAALSLYTLMAAESKPEPSYAGIGLLCAAALVMPWLGRRKRQLAIATRSSALQADAVQSSLCAYLSWIALAGLLLNAVAHLPWADPLAALGLLPIVVKEAKEAFEGRACSCDC